MLVTKDAGFVDRHLLSGSPTKLLLVSTGNIRNQQLELLVSSSINVITQSFDEADFIEIGLTGVVIRR